MVNVSTVNTPPQPDQASPSADSLRSSFAPALERRLLLCYITSRKNISRRCSECVCGRLMSRGCLRVREINKMQASTHSRRSTRTNFSSLNSREWAGVLSDMKKTRWIQKRFRQSQLIDRRIEWLFLLHFYSSPRPISVTLTVKPSCQSI